MTREITARYTSDSPQLEAGVDGEVWALAPELAIDRNWRGDPAPKELQTSVRLLWTDDEIYLGFVCAFTELDIDDEFAPGVERYALWDRDVCEAFIRSPLEPAVTTYKEFEVAPTAQWCDLLIDRAHGVQDWEWKSGMRTAARIDREAGIWQAIMAIPFSAFGIKPAVGSIWQANLFRIGRVSGERNYLAFSATGTEQPSFHVPDRFVDLRFVG